MSTDVATVGDGLVTLFNDGTFSIEVTAERNYGGTCDLPSLATARIDVHAGPKTKVRFNRSQLKVNCTYIAHVRKLLGGAELTGDNVTKATVDAWTAFIDELENVKWSGKFSAVDATIEAVESIPYDHEELKQESLFHGVVSFNCCWYTNQ